MSQSKIGIVGISGRMGQTLREEIANRDQFILSAGYSKENETELSLDDLFIESDLVIDFSNANLVKSVLEAGIKNPKPLIICTTGWDHEAHRSLLDQFVTLAPLIIASNTSVGACIQRYLVRKLAEVLPAEFDIDLHEKHHRFKVDSPSGTAVSLVNEIIDVKKEIHNKDYELYYVGNEARRENQIGVSVQRAGSIVGEHDLSCTSLTEQIEVRHIAFDRALFAQGALTAAHWLIKENRKPEIYSMFDVLNLH